MPADETGFYEVKVSENPIVEVKHIDFLGIIAAVVKKYNLIEIIDDLLPKKSNNFGISHGDALLAMIYMGYGISGKSLYLVSNFFKDRPIKNLFGKHIDINHLNDDVLESVLDAIYHYGVQRFFQDVAFRILATNNLLTKFAYMDSTTKCFAGKKIENTGSIKITYGHSKDHRNDLPQLVQLLITTSDAIPFWSESHSGNTIDKEIFQDAILGVQKYLELRKSDHSFIYVADTALYDKSFLLNKSITGSWITRVPESIGKAKEILEYHTDSIGWTKIDNDYKYCEYIVTHEGKKQRWMLVRNRKSKYKEIATLEKNLTKEEVLIEKNIKAIQKRIYVSKEDAKWDLDKIVKYHPLFKFIHKFKGRYEKVKGHKRKIRIGYMMILSYQRNEVKIQKQKNKKGRFILATDILDYSILSTNDFLQAYRNRNANVEGCFRLFKDPSYRLNKFFLSRVDRIEAMMAVISLIIFTNKLGQKMLRDELKKSQSTIPNQVGKQISNPTLKWAFQLLQQIVSVTVRMNGKIHKTIHGIGETQKTIINCFGDFAHSIYGFA